MVPVGGTDEKFSWVVVLLMLGKLATWVVNVMGLPAVAEPADDVSTVLVTGCTDLA